MILRCERRWRIRVNDIGMLAALLGLMLAGSSSLIAGAQAEGGADLPPPPSFRHEKNNESLPGGSDFMAPAIDAEPESSRRERMRARWEARRNGQDNSRRFRGGRGGDGEGGLPGGGLSRRGHGGGVMGSRLDLSALNLSAEQKSRIQQMRQESRERARTIHQALMSKHQAMRKMIFSPDATDAQIKAAHSEIRKLHDDMEELKFADLMAIRKLLTAEQRKQLAKAAPVPRGLPERLGAN